MEATSRKCRYDVDLGSTFSLPLFLPHPCGVRNNNNELSHHSNSESSFHCVYSDGSHFGQVVRMPPEAVKGADFVASPMVRTHNWNGLGKMQRRMRMKKREENAAAASVSANNKHFSSINASPSLALPHIALLWPPTIRYHWKTRFDRQWPVFVCLQWEGGKQQEKS